MGAKKMNEKVTAIIGKMTEEEKEFVNYISDCIADYIEKKPTDRQTLIAALSHLCRIVFSIETPFDIQEQCREIDHFCEFLKSCALTNKGSLNNERH